MQADQPFLLLRARPKAEASDRFRRWFRTVHLNDVRAIPGIVAIESGLTAGGATLGFYSFAGADAVQTALSSPQASYARGTWEQWAGSLEELLIEIWSPLIPMPLYHSRN
jgi:hypothetical protein